MKLIFIRHGEAEHNVAAAKYGDIAYEDPQYQDAPLTGKGKDQVIQSREEMPELDLIFSSPLIRTLQTASLLRQQFECDVIVTDFLTERRGLGHKCNDRASIPELQRMFPTFQFAMSDPPSHTSDSPVETDEELEQRVESIVNIARCMTDYSCIGFVSHHETLKAYLGESLKNAQWRLFDRPFYSSSGSTQIGISSSGTF
jgi:broad specificity phosphatase PhoE